MLRGRFRTAWGDGGVTVAGGRLNGVELPPLADRAEDAGAWVHAAQGADRIALERWMQQLEAYFRGERLAWTADELGLDEMPFGSFERNVYRTLLSIPPAVTVSYGTLADMAGYPRAARAVGNAMASNPIPIVVPCHRVVRSDGSLGRYGDDPAWKERLLDHEQRHVARSGAKDCDDER